MRLITTNGLTDQSPRRCFGIVETATTRLETTKGPAPPERGSETPPEPEQPTYKEEGARATTDDDNLFPITRKGKLANTQVSKSVLKK